MEAAMKSAIAAGALLAFGLVACGQPATKTDDSPTAAADAAAVGDPCALAPDTAAVFGRAVTAERGPMPNMCQWTSADAVVTGSIIVHGQGWSAVSDAQQAYEQMLSPLAAMTTQPVQGLGDEATMVQIGAQTQIFFRKGGVAVNVGATSDDPALASSALADRIARTVAERL
jgi:hypothetical protein